MCLLIVMRGLHTAHPVLVAGNRDERRDRAASPPGLWVGTRHRVISPRDRRAGGTWQGINDRGLFAGITNLKGFAPAPGAPSRGALVHLALDQGDLAAAQAAVEAETRRHVYAGFQLVLCDGRRTVVLQHRPPQLRPIEIGPALLVISNEHGPGELELSGATAAAAAGLDLAARWQLLQPVLKDTGGEGRHPILKLGADYGTVSSSWIAVAANDPRDLVWQYAAGPPGRTPYRNYGNLGRRLLPEVEDGG